MKVAVYTIALNEAAHVERWANSALEADYRIVADTGSTDDTVERLTRAGVTVHRIAVRPWRFDVARNAAMALIPADVDVCCTMDMDRFLEPGWREKLEATWSAETTALFCRTVYRSSVDEPKPLRWWPAKNFHSRWGYRFKRPVHEALVFAGEKEVTHSCDDIVMSEIQDLTKSTRSQYLPLMELAHREDPEDGQICFWLGREYMWAKRHKESIPVLLRYLALPSSTWREERSEAMRYLARIQPEEKMAWLDRARLEAPHRREVWLDLAEEFHGQSDWLNLFWACSNGIEKTFSTGSYLDEASCWGFRLFDLGAIAAWHLNLMDLAVKWGEKALELTTDVQRPRLKNNLDFFIRRREEVRKAGTDDSNDMQALHPRAVEEEEAWHSLWLRARTFRDSGQDEDFVRTALEAFRRRPQRAEPLHDLARFYLGKSRGDIAIIYADAGMSLPLPEGDRLGVEEEVYHFRLKEAFVIAASYSKNSDKKERGRAICNWLSMDRTFPHWTRLLARQNLRWFAEPASSLFPSIQFNALSVAAPEGFKPGNISLTRLDDGFVALVRAVNYDLLDSGYFDRHGDTSFRQRVLRLQLDRDLKIVGNEEVLPPDDLPAPRHTDSLGFEDPRPFLWRNELWSLSCLRQLNEEGRAEMVLARIANGPQGQNMFVDWRVLASGKPKQWEKNWMPQVVGDTLRFFYSVDPIRILSDCGETLLNEDAPLAIENFRGGSQVVSFDGGWLMLIHEWELAGRRRNYFHRFISLDRNNRLNGISRRFYFIKLASEFASGLAWHKSGDRLVASFGIDDHSPTLAVIGVQDIRMALLDVNVHRRASDRACHAGESALGTLLTPVTSKACS